MSPVTRLLSLVVAAGLSTSALAVEGDWGQVAQALGKSGSEMAGGVYRIGLPRTDLKVVLDGVEVKPALALGSWLAFRSEWDQALVMGDLVLTADEVSPVMQKPAEEGIEITALQRDQSRYRRGHARGRHLHHDHPSRFLQGDWARDIRLPWGDRWRAAGGADRADGQLALRVSGGGAGRQFDRNQEPGAGEPDHRRRLRHRLGRVPHYPLKTRASRRAPVQLDRPVTLSLALIESSNLEPTSNMA
jgi:hypothetical protein